MFPIIKVVLFKHGVGYFERELEVEGDRSLDLHFKASEMNDVLKSLTVLDSADGHVASISYESTLPIEKRLEDVALRLPDGQSQSGLLAQLQGAKVSIEIGSETITGTVMGIETSWRRVDQDSLQEHSLVLLIDEGELRSFPLRELKNLVFLDDALKRDLAHLLEILIGSKKKDKKRLTIFAKGASKRHVTASYVVETPVWKTSYRVILSESEKSWIQGWALVDNTQDEDWNDVSLTLVAGLPVSFVHDLYSPRHQRRPVVRVKEEAAYAPPLLEAGMPFEANEEAGYGAPLPAPMMQARSAPPPPAPGRMRPAAAAPKAEDHERTMVVQTRTVQVGDLFQYVIDRPVSVKRNESALVPVLSARFSGKRVAVYNREIRDRNPMSAIWFENDTGLTLEGGPLTVLERDAYVGEAMLETMKPNDKRLVPFSVELGCLIVIDHKSESRHVHHARIVNGVLYFTRYQLATTIYKIQNKSQATLDLFLEHRFRSGWDLVDTQKPVETTESFYRFRFDAPKDSTMVFTVTEQGDQYESFALTSVSRDKIETWIQSRYIDQATHHALAEIVAYNEGIAALDRDIAACERDIGVIHQNQARLRENLTALGQSRDELKLRERYVSELTRDEDTLAALSTTIANARSEREGADSALRQKLSELTLDARVG
jgi:hypothetical protein